MDRYHAQVFPVKHFETPDLLVQRVFWNNFPVVDLAKAVESHFAFFEIRLYHRINIRLGNRRIYASHDGREFLFIEKPIMIPVVHRENVRVVLFQLLQPVCHYFIGTAFILNFKFIYNLNPKP